MLEALKKNWQLYLIEAWALGMFMLSAALFVILIEHPNLPVRGLIENPFHRRLLTGLAMGITAIVLIYSNWGKRSGAHMNPAVTLTFLQLDRIRPEDATWYIIAQITGGALAITIVKSLLFTYLADPTVNYIATTPGSSGIWVAFGFETMLAFLLFLLVLIVSNHSKLAPFTGYFVGIVLTIYIGWEAPFSGMSINPARTLASAIPSGIWTGWWLYFLGPVLGMQIAGWSYRHWYRTTHDGNCLGMRCHLSGDRHNCATYEILGPKKLLQHEKINSAHGSNWKSGQ